MGLGLDDVPGSGVLCTLVMRRRPEENDLEHPVPTAPLTVTVREMNKYCRPTKP